MKKKPHPPPAPPPIVIGEDEALAMLDRPKFGDPLHIAILHELDQEPKEVVFTVEQAITILQRPKFGDPTHIGVLRKLLKLEAEYGWQWPEQT